jgi:enoyl-CoA hydratase/carnithine racemase
VAVLRLNRPETLNAINEAIQALEADPGAFPREQWRRIAAALH